MTPPADAHLSKSLSLSHYWQSAGALRPLQIPSDAQIKIASFTKRLRTQFQVERVRIPFYLVEFIASDTALPDEINTVNKQRSRLHYDPHLSAAVVQLVQTRRRHQEQTIFWCNQMFFWIIFFGSISCSKRRLLNCGINLKSDLRIGIIFWQISFAAVHSGDC